MPETISYVQQSQDTTATDNSTDFEVAAVFSSYKADTAKSSHRYRMYQLLPELYDVHMMETVGKSVKCVDIQLAVEMLYVATHNKLPDSTR
jgi:hypothetical protein